MKQNQRVNENRRGMYYMMLRGMSDKESVVRFIENSDEYSVINVVMQTIRFGLISGIVFGITNVIIIFSIRGVDGAMYWLPVVIPAYIMIFLYRRALKSRFHRMANNIADDRNE